MLAQYLYSFKKFRTGKKTLKRKKIYKKNPYQQKFLPSGEHYFKSICA